SIIPPEKIIFGITTLGYDWVLPYVPGVTEAAAISDSRAIEIAADNGITIQFNEDAQSPYFFYTENGFLHLVWFKDA
ncbi:MAG TPA: peptidoglycan-binding protein, partial [Clostridium sp.]|nr:peptidoglycan-binding protein [Clostridium sp.]